MYLLAFVTMIVLACQMGSRVLATLLALDLNTSKWTIGLLIATYSVMPLLLAVYAGRVADRFGTRRPMVWGCVAIALGLAIPFVFPAVPALFVSATLIGFGFVFYNVPTQSLAGQYGPKAERTRNFATLSLGYSAANLVGPVSTGYLIEWFDHGIASGVLSVAMLIAVAVLAFSRSLAAPGVSSGAAKPGSSFELLANPELRKIIIASAFIVTGWDLFTFYVPIYGYNIHLSPAQIGQILGAFAIGGFVMRLGLGPLTARFRIRPVLLASMVFGATLYVVFPFIENYLQLLAVAFLVGGALGVGQPLTLTMAFNRSPEGRGGEVTGMRLAINNIAHVTVPVTAGALGSVLGVAPVFALAAGFLLIGGWMSRKA
ncbi:MAG: MFS transporter [Proteobacteria bacterium]|nr:MFS transporter [Burkholderiales bacterium]